MRTVVRRRPDSGLGNIHRQGSAPSRNIDWILMAAVGAISAIGLFVIYSASQSKSAIGALQPYGFYFVTRQELFLGGGVVVMALVMGREYDWFNRSEEHTSEPSHT